MQQFAAALTGAMLRAGVGRVVVESTAFLFRDSILPPAWLVGRLLFPGIVADAFGMERVIRESALDWTIVRPPRLTNKSWTGEYRVRESHLPRLGFTVSRADVADFMVKAVEDHLSSRAIAGVSN